MFICTNETMTVLTKRLPSHKLEPLRTEKEDAFQVDGKKTFSVNLVVLCSCFFLRLLYTKQVEF